MMRMCGCLISREASFKNNTETQSYRLLNANTCFTDLTYRTCPCFLHTSRMHVLLKISLSFNNFFFHFFFTPLSFFLSLCSTVRENKMFSENEIRNIMFQVLSGLVFVHKHGKKLYSVIPKVFPFSCSSILR